MAIPSEESKSIVPLQCCEIILSNIQQKSENIHKQNEIACWNWSDPIADFFAILCYGYDLW